MIKTIKIQLLPNSKQQTKMFNCANAARFVYNWTLGREIQNYKNGGKFLSDCDLRRELTQLKKKEFAWLNGVSNNVTKQAVKDGCLAFKRFFDKKANFPRFKAKRYNKPAFYQDNCKIQFSETHVKLEKIAGSMRKNRQRLNWIKLAEPNRVPTNTKYLNPRVNFDGFNWWLTVGIEEKDCQETPTNEGIGVDLGIKDLAICSDKQVYPNINKTPRVKKIEKKRRRTQRALSRKYEQNKRGEKFVKTKNIEKNKKQLLKVQHKLNNIRHDYLHKTTTEIVRRKPSYICIEDLAVSNMMKNKRGEKFVKTKNIEKNKKQLLKVQHKLNNIRHDYLHKTTTEIVRRKPSYICIEDLAVSNMMKNKHLSKAIQQQIWREFRRQIEYKCAWNNIELIIADRFFPSSKLCSVCGEIKKDLKLSDRTYICDCGNVIDRDFNAAINLREYGKFRDTDTLVGNLRLRRVQGPVSSNSESTLDEVGMEHQSL